MIARTALCLAAALGWLSTASAQVAGGLDRAEAIGPFLDGALPPRTPRPSTGSWSLVNAFPNLTFIDPVQMLPVPFSNRLMVVEKSGRLVVFENASTATTKTVLLDIRSRVESSHDSGMVGLAFHPEFGVPGSPNSQYLYVYYRYTPQKTDKDRAYCRLSRFVWNPSTNAIASSSESVLINQYDRQNWHNGGGLFFGADGFLYLSIGDEGGSNDQYNSAQRMDVGLLSGVLRIDVDRDSSRSHAIRRQPRNPSTPPSGWPGSYSQGYFIPNDNPWQNPSGTLLEEFYAVGLRSPHRMTLDPVTGDIWVGDVGQGTQEEISRIVRGGNLQWPYREGSVAGPKSKPASLIGFDVPPVHAYGRGTGICVIGGYVYRGSLHPELEGKYLFGDHGTGQIWSLDASGPSPVITSLLTMTSHGPGPKNGLGSFGIDSSGEIYALSLAGTDLDGGRIYRLEKSSQGVPEPPTLLSQTGAFTDLAALAPAPGVIPYGVNQPLWSDGAAKRRWIALPNDGVPNTPAERIAWSEEDPWGFPAGTVMIKHFEFDQRRLETRFLVNGDDGSWYGFTYRWREDGSDAELLPGDPLVETVDDGGVARTWHFPGRTQCFSCHTTAGGRPLGVKTSQLNGDFFYEATGRVANQLVTLNRLGFLSPALDEASLPAMLTSRRQDDVTASLERRARSYLDVNCAHCHQPAAPTQAAFDARLTTPPWHQNLLNVAPGNPFGILDARLIAPGEVARSLIPLRVGSTTEGVAMPPLAKHRVDAAGLQLLQEWIGSLDPAIGPTGPVPGPAPADHSPPILTLTAASQSPVVDGPFTVTLLASEPIAGLAAEDLTVINGTVTEVTGSGSIWTVTVAPASPGEGAVTLAADRVTDLRGNANETLVDALLFDFVPPPPGSGMLGNGGFEGGLGGWYHGGSVAAGSEAHSGTGSVTIGGSSFIVQNIAVSELGNYRFSGWSRSAATGAGAQAGLTFWDRNGVWIQDRVVTLAPGMSWDDFELAFTAPVGAASVSVWILTGATGSISVDDLDLAEGGPGEPRPAYQPGVTNLISNGDFESGALAPWETGGTDAGLSAQPHTGLAAARLGGGAFIVQSRAATPGEAIALFGAARTSGGGGRLEAGFSFWDAGGAWITDRTLVLPETGLYETFLVDTIVPEGAASLSAWVWRTEGGDAFVDDLVVFRPDEEPDPEPVNLLTNPGFESGSLTPWDSGGSNVTLAGGGRSGAYAATLGIDSFLVLNRSIAAGQELTFSGHQLSPAAAGAVREAGFSYWGASGEWLGDAITTLNPAAAWSPFSVNGVAPVGAASVSVWLWSGSGGDLTVDDLMLSQPID